MHINVYNMYMYYIYIHTVYTFHNQRTTAAVLAKSRRRQWGSLVRPPLPHGRQDHPSDVDPVDPVLTKVQWPDTEEESSIQDLPPPVPCLATSLLIEAVGRSRQSPNSPCSSPRDEKRSTLAYRDHEVYISHSGSFLISNV